MNSLVVRRAAVLASGALVATMLATTSAQAAVIPAPAGSDRSPAAAGAAYLATQPSATTGIIPSYFGGSSYPDVGLTIDAATSLDAVGGQPAAVAKMLAGVQGAVDDYTKPGFGTNVSANATAKAGAFAITVGANPADFGGVNLVTQLEALVDANGRIADDYDTSNPDAADYASPLGQAYANQLLYTRSAKSDSVLVDLKRQQCAGTDKGYFRASFADKVCSNDPTAVASVDTTAFAILALQAQKGRVVTSGNLTADVTEMINKGVQWLTQVQAADGSFKNTAGVVNANSTGLAGWALGVSGIRENATARAAAWLRGRQLANAGGCAPYAAGLNGAVVPDDLLLNTANAGPLNQDQQSTATRATAQALPALVFSAGGPTAGDTALTGPAGYQPAATTSSVRFVGAPGNTLCVSAGAAVSRVVLDATGVAVVSVALPATTGTASVGSIAADGETDVVGISVLGATKLVVKVKHGGKVRKGRTVVVKVKGLAPGEPVRLKYKGVKIGAGTATAQGRVRVEFKARKVNRGKVKAIGLFGDRRGKDRLTITK